VIGVITALHAFRGTPDASPSWPFDAGAAVYTRPFVVSNVVYVGSTNGHVYALNTGNGAVRWQYPRAGRPQMGAVYSRPGVAGQWLYVGSDHGRIDALNTASGALRWSRRCDQAGDRILSSPVFADGVVYATSGGFACALNAADGARFWNPVPIGAIADTGPTVSLHGAGTPRSRITLYFGSADGHLYALNASTGQVRWQYPGKGRLPIAAVDSQPMVSVDGAVYFGTTDGHLYALNASDGAVRWKYPRRGALASGAVDSQPAVTADGSRVYFATGFDVYGLNSSGRLLFLWSQDPVPLRSAIASSGLVVTQSEVYVGSGHSVSCLNVVNGRPCWPRPFPADSAVVSTPVVNNNGKIYFGTLDGKVYALTPSGKLVHAR
jgi:eukaryotic-like serine/threonine-protein kinase